MNVAKTFDEYYIVEA